MSADLVRRLEVVAARLEQYASNVSAGGGSSESKGAGGPSVDGWNAIYAKNFVAFLEVANKFDALKKTAALAEASFLVTGKVIQAATECKKPSDTDLLAFAKDTVTAIEESGKFNDNRNEFFNHLKAFAEAIQGFGWIMQTTPKQVIIGQLEAADFYLVKILTDGKKKGGDVGTDYKNYALSLKGLMNDMAAYAQEFHKTGIDWNPRGVKLSDWTGGSGGGVPPPPGPPEPPGPPPPPGPAPDMGTGADPAAGRAALFTQLTGGDVTSGLKKVTSDMKAKNQKDKPVLEPKKKAAAASEGEAKKWSGGEKKQEKKEPKMSLSKTTWFIENYEGPNNLEVPEDQLEQKQNVYILNAKNLTISLPAKVKSIQIDGCSKARIVFKSVVSLCEVFNSTRVKIECTDTCPSYAIDKTNGASIEISRAQLANPPDIITSNISECNVVMPGATDESDPIEVPLPEQYITKINPADKTLSTTPVVHGG